MQTLDGDVVVVTGASRGLGREMALRLSAEGARVVLLARNAEDLRAVAEEGSGETLPVPTDVTDAAAVERAVERTMDAYGRIDTLVNNAGIGLLTLHDTGKPLAEVTESEWEHILSVNLTGVFLCTRAVLPAMVEQGRGNVVNISSGAGRHAVPGWAPYVTTKWGLEGLTRTVALEYEADGVNVNALDPGGRVDTRFWDHLPDEERREIRRPDVMNEAAVLLSAQGPDGVTGESMPAEAWEERLSD